MSVHIDISNEAKEELKRRKNRERIASLGITLLTMASLGIGLYLLKVAFIDNTRPEMISYNPPAGNSDEPNKKEVVRPSSQTSSASPQAARVIASTAPSSISINVPDIVVDSPTLGISDGLSLGFHGLGNGPSGGGQGFGDANAKNGLVGTFYDLKQTSGKAPVPMTNELCAKTLQEYLKRNWDDSLLAKYYKSPVKLKASQFYIPFCQAAEAPKAYQCEKEVQPSKWVAIYKGTVTPSVSGTFRFVGAGDDALAVSFNNENVFDYGWYQLSLGQIACDGSWRNAMNGNGDQSKIKRLKEAKVNVGPVNFYKYSELREWNNYLGGLATGKTFTVQAGKSYPMQVLISEINGGNFGATLFLEKVGSEPAKKEANGSPILPLFRTSWDLPNKELLDKLGCKQRPPYDEIGPVWPTPESK